MPFLKSLPGICIALGFADPEELLQQARQETEAGETFLEFRLDYLRQPRAGIAAIHDFLEEHPECVILATCRRRQNQWTLQRQHRGAVPPVGSGGGGRSQGGRHRDRKRGAGCPRLAPTARDRPAAGLLPQLRGNAALGDRVAPHAAVSGRRLQDRHHGSEAVRCATAYWHWPRHTPGRKSSCWRWEKWVSRPGCFPPGSAGSSPTPLLPRPRGPRPAR